MPAADTIRDRIARRDRFSYAEIAALIADESDLDVWSAVYDALGKGYDRIKPEPGMETTCSFMLRYLLRCIRENPAHEHMHSGYEAAFELAACLKHWALRLPETECVMQLSASELTEEFLAGDEGVRDRLLNGTLEHALEAARVRQFFDHWRHDPAVSEAWQLAMEWAVAHGDPVMPPNNQ